MSEEAIPTIDDTMGAVFDRIEAGDTVDAADATAGSSVAGGEEEANRADTSNRDERGRFTKREAAEGATVQDTDADTAEDTTDQGNDSKADPAKAQPVMPPDRWSAEEKAEFAQLSPGLQATVLRREADRDRAFHQKSQELAEQRRQFEQLEHVIAPRRQMLAMEGGEAAGLTKLFAISDFAMQDAPGFIRWFAQTRGIDLSGLTQAAESTQVDPALSPLTRRLDQIEQSISQRERDEQARAQQAELARIEAFRNDPKHPYFEEVRVHMSALVRQGIAKDLEDAYEQAIYANPSVRAKVLADQRQAEEAKRIQEAKEAAAKARKAAGTNLSPKGSPPGSRTTRSIDETMSETFDRVQGAA